MSKTFISQSNEAVKPDRELLEVEEVSVFFAVDSSLIL